MKLYIFPFPVRGKEPARQWCYISFSGNVGRRRRTVTHSTVIAHQLRSTVSLTKDLCDPDYDQQQSRNELAELCQLEWEWEREEMGIANGHGKGMGIKLG